MGKNAEVVGKVAGMLAMGCFTRGDLDVEHDGVRHRINFRRMAVIDVSVKSVALLTPDSAPTNGRLLDTAEKDFNAALEALIKKGEPFCTELRPGWCWPVFLFSNGSHLPNGNGNGKG